MAAKPERILIIALPGIGDALLSTPMLRLLREARPNAEIHILVMFAATRDLFTQNPCVDHLHYFDFIHSNKVEGLLFLLHLRSIGFDVSINIYPQNRREYNIFSLIVGASRRLGVRYRRRDWQNLNWLSSETIAEDDALHCVEENVKLLHLLGITVPLKEGSLPKLEIYTSKENERFADEWMKEHDLQGTLPIVGLHAGTALFKNHIKRRWAPDKFAALAKELHLSHGAKVLLFGGPDDREANDEIMKLAAEHITLVKTPSIMDSVALMKRCSLFVSNDSALMHIAGALTLPTVALFGPTNETYVHPWKTPFEIVQTGIECRPCFIYSPKPLTCYRADPAEHFICIRAISVEDVVQAVQRMNAEP